MKLPNFGEISKAFTRNLGQNSPAILMGLGIAGMFSSVFLAVKATPKALQDLDQKKKAVRDEKLKAKEVLGATWKNYIPTAIMLGVSAGCFMGSAHISNKRNVAMATAYGLSETAFRTYREKVIESIGEKKEQSVRDAVARETLLANPQTSGNVIVASSGDMTCFDGTSGRYFKCTVDKLRRAENEINRRMLDEMYISLNEFYYEIGLPPIKAGDDLGWNYSKGFLEIRLSSHLNEKEEPCLVLDYVVYPDFKRY